MAVRGGLWGLRIQRFESQVPRFPPSLFHGFRGICPIYIFLPLSTPQTPALPPSRTGMGKQSARRRVPQVFRDSVSPPKGEDPLQDGKHLEAPEEVAGGGCRGESPRSHHGSEAYLL